MYYSLVFQQFYQFLFSYFEQKLDSNINLIGFENGIYDLEQGSFREGRPDDYITLSTKNDYYKWNDKNPFNTHIFKFFDQVLPNKSEKTILIYQTTSVLKVTTKTNKSLSQINVCIVLSIKTMIFKKKIFLVLAFIIKN